MVQSSAKCELTDILYILHLKVVTFAIPGVVVQLIIPILYRRKTQYMYAAIMEVPGKFSGVGKFDLTKEPEANPKSLDEGGDCEGLFVYGAGKFGGEAVLVPRNPDQKMMAI